jgi:hypothetical protein
MVYNSESRSYYVLTRVGIYIANLQIRRQQISLKYGDILDARIRFIPRLTDECLAQREITGKTVTSIREARRNAQTSDHCSATCSQLN